MKYIDLIIQTLIIAAGLFWILSTSHSDSIFMILIIQMFLGPWQYLSSLVSSIARGRYRKAKGVHLILSTLYLLMLFASPLELSDSTQLIVGFLIIPSWMLGIYYYVLSWKCVIRQANKQSKFLPHTSF